MKHIRFFAASLMICLLLFAKTSYQQTTTSYQLPNSFSFDYEVVQSSENKKNGDTATMHFFYTKSGDYAAVKISGRQGMMMNKFIIITKDGMGVIFDDDRKDVSVINTRNILSDLMSLARLMKKDTMYMRDKFAGKNISAVKSGNTKQVSGYTAEEYKISDSGAYKASIWIAKVDFNTQLYYLMRAIGNMPKMNNMQMPMQNNPLMQTLIDPKNLITEITTAESADGKGFNMHTTSITSSSMIKSTTGYKVNDYSNMDLRQMIEKGKQQRSTY